MAKRSMMVIVVLVSSVLLVAGFYYFYIRGRSPAIHESKPPSNSWIMDPATIEYEKPKENYGERQWWAWYGYAYTADRTSELFLNGNIFLLANVLNGSSYTLDGKATPAYLESINWNATSNYLYGTLKTSDGTKYSWSLSFPEDGYRIYEQKNQDEALKVEMQSRGVPLWGGRTEEEMVKFAFHFETPVYAGGFHDIVTIHAVLTRPSGTLVFDGFGMYARVWITPIRQTRGNTVLCFVNEASEFYLSIVYARNPYNLSQVLVQSGRIGFPQRGEAYQFDSFTYYGLYGRRPETFQLQGTFEKGSVSLTGENIGWLQYDQNHPFIRWKGTITVDENTISVDSLGSGEVQAVVEPPQ